MKFTGLWKHLLLAFLAALALYAVLFYAIERRRTSAGPWQVHFGGAAEGAPALTINQPHLGLTNVKIVFSGGRAPAKPVQAMAFAEARTVPFDVPFGRCVFLDTISLPGTVVLQLYGHDIQLMPRVLTIDRIEHPWHSGETLRLQATNAPGG